MSNLTYLMDGFARDENGKIVALPMKLPAPVEPPSWTKKSDEKRTTVRRKYIPIEPLPYNTDFAELDNPIKKIKLERPVRKELFKLPQKKPEKRFTSFSSRRSITKTSASKTSRTSSVLKKKANQQKKTQVALNDGSPLFDVEEAEELLCQNRAITKTVKTVLFPMTSIKEELDTKVNNNNSLKKPPATEVTPTSSLESDLEFLELEKQLASVKKSVRKTDPASPMTSVCTLFEKTKIEERSSPQKNILNDILALVRESLDQVQTMKQEFEAQQQRFNSAVQEQQRKLENIIKVLEQCDENKENINRRSTRIATQSVKKFIISPAISKKVDLRKSTLNKNMSRNFNCESPRMQKAVDRYNSMRSDYSVLCTPKLDRSNMDIPEGSVTRSLSRRIQKQCLLLQDSPKPSC